MEQRRANGEENTRSHKDGCWEERYTAGQDSTTGKAIVKNFLGKTQAEVKEKLKKQIFCVHIVMLFDDLIAGKR